MNFEPIKKSLERVISNYPFVDKQKGDYNLELEFSLGYKEGIPYQPYIDKVKYDRLIEILNEFDIDAEESYSIITTNNLPNINDRKIININLKEKEKEGEKKGDNKRYTEIIEEKENISKFDELLVSTSETRYFIRIKISKEKTKNVIKSSHNVMKFRYRRTYYIHNWKIEVSKIKQKISTSKKDSDEILVLMDEFKKQPTKFEFDKYEIEIEHLNDRKLKYDEVKTLFSYIKRDSADFAALFKYLALNNFDDFKQKLFLRCLRDELCITDKPLFQINIDTFINKPATFEKRNFVDIDLVNYTATYKVDGQTAFYTNIYLDGLFLIGKTLKQLDFNIDIDFDIFIIGEFLNNKFYPFDIYLYDDKLLINHKYTDRIKYMKKLESKCDNIIIKDFQTGGKNSRENIKKLVANKPEFVYDGIILTSNGAVFDDQIFKWKMEHSLDFKIKKVNDGMAYLYVGIDSLRAKSIENIMKNYNIHAKHIYYAENNSRYKHILFVVNGYGDSKYHTLVDSELTKYKSGDILELFWKNDKWNILKKRDDKVVANNYDTAVSVWSSIVDYVSLDLLCGNEKVSSYWSNAISNNTEIQNMLKYHSHVKMLYYDKYAKNSRLLELAGGKANDIRKWINSTISFVTLVEIDVIAIEEAKKRAKEAKWEKIEFINLDLQKNIYINNKPYDVVSCQFAFHYFLKDETTLNNIFSTIDKNLIKDGRLMISCLDGKKVLELFEKEKSNTIFMKENKKNLFILKVDDYKESINKFKKSLIGNSLDVYVQTIGTLNREYLVNFELLNKYLSEKKYRLIEKFDFQPSPKFKQAEKNYSSLNFMAIFQKIR